MTEFVGCDGAGMVTREVKTPDPALVEKWKAIVARALAGLPTEYSARAHIHTDTQAEFDAAAVGHGIHTMRLGDGAYFDSCDIPGGVTVMGPRRREEHAGV